MPWARNDALTKNKGRLTTDLHVSGEWDNTLFEQLAKIGSIRLKKE